MFRTTSRTLLRAGFALAVFCSWPPGASIGQTVCPAATISPPSATAGTSPQLTLNTNGTIDLGNLTTKQFGIKPDFGITITQVTRQVPQTLVFTMAIPETAQEGTWTFFVNDASGHEVVALDFGINPFISGKCNPPDATCPCHQAGFICVKGCCVSSQ
jgi:hypothetical protein